MKICLPLVICATVLLSGCSSEKAEPANPPPPAQTSSPILNPQIQTLHKAEQVDQLVTDETAEQRQQIDAATQ
jgi:outer membrane murein-binding lipoprotein Lpp